MYQKKQMDMGDLVDLELYRQKRRRRHARPHQRPTPQEGSGAVPALPHPIQAPRLDEPSRGEGSGAEATSTVRTPVVFAPKERDDPTSA